MKKVVVLTGCAGGLGRELLKSWKNSSDYVLVSLVRNADSGKAFGLEVIGSKLRCYPVDLTDEKAVLSTASEIQGELGAPWGIVNLAGVSNNGLSWKMSSEEFRTVLDGNLLTAFHVVRAFLPAMRSFGRGRIVNISSVVASSGVFGASAYMAAKSALEGYTRAVAIENAAKGITANCLALGYFDSGMINSVPEQMRQEITSRTPVGRLGTGSDLSAALDYLLSESSGFVTGQTVGLNGGLYFR
jgi:NAD(P)-dependent dehydrogenase (short-subunit alcohol dehydrogenase family)